jgi:hypothetical protein
MLNRQKLLEVGVMAVILITIDQVASIAQLAPSSTIIAMMLALLIYTVIYFSRDERILEVHDNHLNNL